MIGSSMDNLALDILRTLKKYGPMEASILAIVIDKDENENEVNHCLYNRLKDYCVQNEKSEWMLSPSASTRSYDSGLDSTTCKEDRSV